MIKEVVTHYFGVFSKRMVKLYKLNKARADVLNFRFIRLCLLTQIK